MFDQTRIVSTCVFLVSMIATLICAFYVDNVALIIILCFVQYFALIWYSLSYIPYARDVVTRVLFGWMKT